MNEAARLFDMISTQRKGLTTIERGVGKIVKLDSDRHVNLSRIESELAKLRDQLSKSTILLPQDFLEELQRFEDAVSHERHELERKFGSQLASLLQDDGFKLKGQMPELKSGLFTIEVNTKRGRAQLWYGPKQEVVDRNLPGSPKAVADALLKSKAQLERSDSYYPDFLKNCRNAYVRTLQLEELTTGAPVAITSVLSELAFLQQDHKFLSDPRKENFRDYGRMQFSYDLFRLPSRQVDGLELRLTTAARSRTTKRSDFLWVPHNEYGEGSAYSHIQFKEVMR